MDWKNNVVVQFAILVIAVTGGQYALKIGAGYLPDSGFFGAIKHVFGGGKLN